MMSKRVPFLSSSLMRAAVVSKFGGVEVLEIQRNVPIPKIEDSEVLVRVAAVGVNPVETYIRSGNYPKLPMLPYIPGNDLCGTVIKVGCRVKRFQDGDRVCSYRCESGSYAEFASVNEMNLLKLENNMDFLKGAAVGTPYLTAYRALCQTVQIKPSQNILIHGASGGVGIAAVQIASMFGMNIIGTAGTEEGMQLVRSLGVKYVFNHRQEGYANQIMDVTNGEGVDVVVEMLSNVNLDRDLGLVKRNGTVLVVGCRGPIEINPRLLMAKESKIFGVMFSGATTQELDDAKKFVENGLCRGLLDPVVGPKYSLNDVQQAHEDIIHNTGSKGKMVLIM